MSAYLRMNVVRVVRLVELLRRRGFEGGEVLEVGSWFGSFALAVRRLGYGGVACDRYSSYGAAFDSQVELMVGRGNPHRLDGPRRRAPAVCGPRPVRRRADQGQSSSTFRIRPGFSSRRCTTRCDPAASTRSIRRTWLATGTGARSRGARRSFSRSRTGTSAMRPGKDTTASTRPENSAGCSSKSAARTSASSSSTTTCSSSRSSRARTPRPRHHFRGSQPVGHALAAGRRAFAESLVPATPSAS
jgi:hypothetical protein